jgi:DNA-binding NarL/FixJ family response regulator
MPKPKEVRIIQLIDANIQDALQTGDTKQARLGVALKRDYQRRIAEGYRDRPHRIEIPSPPQIVAPPVSGKFGISSIGDSVKRLLQENHCGLTQTEIAEAGGISLHTAQAHLRRLKNEGAILEQPAPPSKTPGTGRRPKVYRIKPE